MDEYFNYRNFKMGTELDIAGTFIYDGINTLKTMESFDIESEVFSFLYHIAIGIERMQKIIIVLVDDITDIDKFEKSLITHSHRELHDRIRHHRVISFNGRQNEFIDLLSSFYKGGRYNNYLVNSNLYQHIIAINDYIKKHSIYSNTQKYFEENLDKQKETLGRVVGSIVKKYFNIIKKISSEKNIYTYETSHASKARKIFVPEYNKNSLHRINANELIALKELLIYIVNTKEKNGFMGFLKSIVPLELDNALIQEYISEVIVGKIPQDLIDHVENIYYDEDNLKNRLEQLSLIGSKYVFFDDYEEEEKEEEKEEEEDEDEEEISY
ncbi:hypothetical protein [Ammoniphilus sp. CFH 90114]|uniref:hypothetical protein n=1 Tax=Ammoniphilus sp. CFH 90114 TaxID=2493665 RepID=UPI00196A31A7|nr:hypothetical protein [Ammoniphilus sp. CFH 90114]